VLHSLHDWWLVLHSLHDWWLVLHSLHDCTACMTASVQDETCGVSVETHHVEELPLP
jgi:hypothetical protein